MQHQIIGKKPIVDLAASNNDTLVNSAVTVYPIHINYEEQWQHTPLLEPNTHDERLWFYFATTDTNVWAGIQLPTSNRRLSTSYSRNTPQGFYRGTRSLLSRGQPNTCRRPWHTDKVSRKFARESVMLWPRQNCTGLPRALVKLLLDIFFQGPWHKLFQGG